MGRFGRTPEEVYLNPRLNMTAKVVYGALAMFRNGRTGQCNPSRASLCKSLGITRRPLAYALRALEEQGEIISHYEPGRQPWYELRRLDNEAPAPEEISTSGIAGNSTPGAAGIST